MILPSFKRHAKNALRRLGLLNLAWDSALLAGAVTSFPRNVSFWKKGAEDGLAIPPLSFIASVTGSCDVRWFLESGKSAFQSITHVLVRNALQINDFHDILDFGCGCGRVIRHVGRLDGGRIYGTDINSELISWSNRNLPFASFGNNDLSPPLKYPDQTFDFVFALSVFTHMTEQLQLSWMHELSRVLRQGGYLLITTHSARDIHGQLSETEGERFREGKLVVQGENLAGTNLCTAYHPATFIREKLIEGYSVVDFVEEGARGNPFQDIFLLKKA